MSAPRGTAASLPCWSQLSPSPHGAKPTKAQEQTVQDRSTICRETRQRSGPGHLSSDLGEGRLHHAETWIRHWARGPWHTAPAGHDGTLTAKEPPGLAVCPHVCSGMEMLFTLPVTQCLLINTGNQPGGEGTKGGERQGKGHCSSCCHYPYSSWDGTIWVQSWEQLAWEACLSSPKGRPKEVSPGAVQGIPAK